MPSVERNQCSCLTNQVTHSCDSIVWDNSHWMEERACEARTDDAPICSNLWLWLWVTITFEKPTVNAILVINFLQPEGKTHTLMHLVRAQNHIFGHQLRLMKKQVENMWNMESRRSTPSLLKYREISQEKFYFCPLTYQHEKLLCDLEKEN